MSARQPVRLGADIGGTFTDIALDCGGQIYSCKVLTNYAAPEQAILDGISIVVEQAGISASDIDIVIHGTTLATNALIERRGPRTAFITTEGFRDVIEMHTESRFAQYDLNLRLPSPLIPREHRLTVTGRIGARGQELLPLDGAALDALGKRIATGGFGAVAIGFIHAYMNPAHERRARDIIAATFTGPISISSDVSPQMREFERFNTVCANAYLRPLMSDYLLRLQSRLIEMGATCPVFMIHSGGGLVSVETASEFSVRLVESGPAGGAIKLSATKAETAVDRDIGRQLKLTAQSAAFGICEVVDENMANAARVHAVENGKNVSDNIMIAFGGAAPPARSKAVREARHRSVPGAARGRNGGKDGAPGSVTLDDGTKLKPKGWQHVPADRRLILQLPGGGGYGDPAQRSEGARADDHSKGYLK